MMTSLIITFCILILIAYVFDLTSSKTKIPSVILLLVLGWAVRQGANFVGFQLPGLPTLLTILGTVGLILIVLEGSLELEFNKSKFKLIRKSFLGATVSIITLAATFSFLFWYVGGYGLKNCLINSIPFCIISSAIAIPSVRNLSSSHREFVTYESSLSDIIGVLVFNFFALNQIIDAHSFQNFGIQLMIIILVSFVATVGLSFLLHKIEHHVKFVPIILLVILIYAVSKVYHLPGLVFILIFGLFLNNLDELKQYKWTEKFKLEELNKEIHKFKELTIEAAFLIRTLFFLLFGYLIDSAEVINTDTLPWAALIVMIIFIYRAVQLRISRLPLSPLLFVAPRGLITVLLFLSIEQSQSILHVNKALVIQVVILTALVMMIGMFSNKRATNDLEVSVKSH